MRRNLLHNLPDYAQVRTCVIKTTRRSPNFRASYKTLDESVKSRQAGRMRVVILAGFIGAQPWL
jgi:hypothetical protein